MRHFLSGIIQRQRTDGVFDCAPHYRGRRKKNGKRLATLALCGLCSFGSNAGWGKEQSLQELFDEYYRFRLEINPTEATKLGENEYNSKSANFISEPYRKKLIKRYGEFLRAIDRIQNQAMDPADRLSLGVMRWDSEIKRQGLENPLVTIASPIYDIPNFQLLPLAQISSYHLYFSQLGSGVSIQPFNSVEDYDNWLQRVDGYLLWLQTAEENFREGMNKGWVWPKVLVRRTIDQLNELITDDLSTHIYYGPIRRLPPGFPGQDKQRLQKAYREMVLKQINPAHQRLSNFLEQQYLPAAGDHTGLGDLPGGAETYRYLIRYHTTTDMTPDAIHELGKSEVKRIAAEMLAVKNEVGFEGDLPAFFDWVRNSKKLMPFTRPEQVIEHFQSIADTAAPNIASQFAEQPKADFVIRRTEAFREKSAAAEYLPGSKDGKRPGIFYVPVADASKHNILADEALYLHEAIPGHHYQLSLQQENQQLPKFLHPESIGVFVEGWALYAESLGYELGLYRDPYQRLGMLSMEMHRAIRLVVDTGMHAKGWTREQAIEYSLAHEAESEASITAEIERYMATPGQALAYKIGQLKIRELREKSAAALGDEFDIREFHSQVLGSGSLPLVLLEEKLEGWIATSSAAR